MKYPHIFWQIHKTTGSGWDEWDYLELFASVSINNPVVIVSESRSCFTPSRKQTKCNKDPWQALTYSQLLSEDSAFTQRRAVPAAVSELVLAFVDAQLCPLSDHDDGVWPALADGALAGCETGDLIADDVRTKGHHRGKSPVGQKRQTQLVKMNITCIIAYGGQFMTLNTHQN